MVKVDQKEETKFKCKCEGVDRRVRSKHNKKRKCFKKLDDREKKKRHKQRCVDYRIN